MPLAPGTRLGNYEITANIGAGGMGEVYKARDTQLNRDVAIKVLPASLANDSDYLARFQREAQALAALHHPNIASIFGLEKNAIVMEFVEGRDLSGPLPADELLPIARQIADALEAAHDKGIVHRDLKPANIRITPQGVVKVLDFGLAKTMERPTAISANSPTLTLRATEAGLILGTAAYMSPEQARGRAVDRRSDIWAFGAVLFELATGKQPFPGETVADILAAILKNEPDFDSVPPPLRRLVRRCMEKDPKRRLQAIADYPLLLEDTTRYTRPSKLPWIAAAIAGIIAIAAITLYLRRPPAEVQQSLQFQVHPPEKSVIQYFAISSDGRRLAMSADTAGTSQIWVREMDSILLRLIPGTAGASHPFWSPDGRDIGFFANGKLKRVPADGGPPVVLADAAEGRGGTWNAQNQIVFAPYQSARLLVISASGGTPTPVPTGDDQGPQRFPFFLPDGKRILSLHRMARKEKQAIYVSSLDGGPPRLVLDVDSSAVWQSIPGDSNFGNILYRRDDSFVAQRFHASSLEPAGDPIAFGEKMADQTLARILASVSANGTLAVQQGVAAPRSNLTWYSRAGTRLSTVGPPADRDSFVPSPDGKAVAARTSRERKQAVWLVDLDLGTETRLTSDINGTPQLWTLSGKEVVLSSRDGSQSTLFLVNRSGSGEPKLLLQSDTRLSAYDWTPDGKTLLFGERSADGQQDDLWTLPDPAQKPRLYFKTPFDERNARFSRDGRWVAYASNESGHNEVYIRSFPDGEEVRRVSTDGGDRPLWKQDGSELYYQANANSVMAVPIKLQPKSIQLGTPVPLFQFTPPARISGSLQADRSVEYNYAVSRDGQRFLVLESADENISAPLHVITNWFPKPKAQ